MSDRKGNYPSKHDWNRHKPKYLIAGKSVEECAKQIGVSKIRAYQMARSGDLEARLNGTWKPKVRDVTNCGSQQKPMHGKTASEWSVELGISQPSVYQWNRRGWLKKVARGADPNKFKHARPYKGMKLGDIAKQLGVSRQRVDQLKKRGQLDDRLAGVDRWEKWQSEVKSKNDSRFDGVYDANKTIQQMVDE